MIAASSPLLESLPRNQSPTLLVVPQPETGESELPDYHGYDTPPSIRKQQRAVGHDIIDSQEDLELLDIPAFLRRQAD